MVYGLRLRLRHLWRPRSASRPTDPHEGQLNALSLYRQSYTHLLVLTYVSIHAVAALHPAASCEDKLSHCRHFHLDACFGRRAMAKRYERFDALQAELGKAGDASAVEQDDTGDDAVDDAVTNGAERYAKVLDEEGNEQPLDADEGEPEEEPKPRLYSPDCRSTEEREACFIQSPPRKSPRGKAEPPQPVPRATRVAAVSAGEDDIEQYEIQGDDAHSDGAQEEGEQQYEEVGEEIDEDLEELRPPSSEDQRSPEELEAIQYEILELESEIQIAKRYKIIDRLGEGESARRIHRAFAR